MADKSDVIQDYLNSLNEAMAIHAKKAIEGLEFDRTETAEIVDITNRDKGEYQVFNGSARYFAYSENTSYTLGTKVYVTIPNNDYSQQKLIKGKYKSGDNDTNISWTSPLKGYSPGTGNLIEDAEVKDSSSTFSNSSIGLENIPVKANYNNENGDSLLTNYNDVSGNISEEPLGEQSRYAPQYKVLYLSQSLYDNEIYNQCFGYMGISAEFKTALNGFNVISGSYGLLILIDYYQKVEAPVEEPIHKLKVCKLDTTSMVGSVYNFNTFYKQEALYKLNNDKEAGMIIDKVAVLFYQDGEFRNNDNELISPLYGETVIPYNIFVKNINIKFGDDIEGKPDDIAEIYTNNGLSYDSAQTNDKLNEKLIHLKWQHKNPEPILEDDGTYEYEYELMDRNDLKDIPTDADVKLIGNIHWYTDASYTIDAYRATQEQTSIANDRLYELSEKWKYYPHSMSEGEYRDLVLAANFTPKKDYQWTWDATRGLYELDENGYYKLDENGNQIPVYQVNEDGEYILDENGNKIQATGMRELQISATGEQVLSRTIVRNAREDLTSRVSDDLAGPNWIPIDGTFNDFDIEYQPDLTRGECSVKCIIEYGPELLEENEETGEMIKTGLVDPNSSYYVIIEPEIITFKNLSWTPDLTTMDAITGVTLTVDDQTEGHYPIYNATDGRILRRSERDKLRSLKADIVSTYTGASLLNGNEILLWQVPKTNTMIDIAGTLTNSKSEVVSADNFSNIAINTTDLYNSKINKTFDVLTDESTRNNFVIISNRNKDTLYIPQLDNIIARFNELQSNHAQTLRNIESEYEEHNDEYMRAIQAAKTDYEASIAAIKRNAQVNILDEINKNIEETLTEGQIAAIKNIDDNVISSFTQVLSIENWFDLEGFDFDNYYYLVRFGSNVAGVNPYQGYRINEYYKRNATNNTIFCYLVKNNQIYKGNITLTFGQHGSSGTDYTFTLGLGELVKKPDGLEVINGDAVDETDAEWEVVGPAASALTVGETNFRRIVFDLYDSTNTIINLTEEQKNDIIKKWVARSEDGFYSGNTNARNLEILVKRKAIAVDEITTEYYYTDIAIRAKNNVALEDLRYIILSASVRSMATSGFNDTDYEVGPVNFIQMMPLHIRKDEAYSLNGADYITYDDKGALPQSYSDEYDLINVEDEVFKIIVDGVALTSGVRGNQHTTYKYYPHLDENNKLIPCAIYVSNLSKQVAVEAYDSNNTLLYTMPLLIIQNRYQIPALNSWNGKLLIDEANNRVMAATMAAGHKNDDNTFTGVIMGDVNRISSETGNTRTKTSGLFGYNAGAESFGWMSDGTGFIGKAGKGQILLDGNKSTIQSANYKATKELNLKDINNKTIREGTLMDLDEGSIDMWGNGGYTYNYGYSTNEGKMIWNYTNTGADTLSTNIHLDTNGSATKPYFRIAVPAASGTEEMTYEDEQEHEQQVTLIDDTGLKPLIKIARNDYYLQTADYGTNSGLRIDLQKGTFDSKGKLTINGGLGSRIHFGDDSNYINFAINNSGKSTFEMMAGAGTKTQIETAAANLVSLAADLNAFLYDSWLNGDQTAWSPVNASSVFKTPERVKRYNSTATVNVVFPKNDSTYFSTLLTKLTSKALPNTSYIGFIKDENLTASDYLSRGMMSDPITLTRSSHTLTKGVKYYQSEIIEYKTYQKDESGNYILDDESNPIIEEVAYRTLYSSINQNQVNAYFAEHTEQNATLEVYTKGYDTWLETIGPWQAAVLYDKGQKVFVAKSNGEPYIDNTTGLPIIYVCLTANNRNKNPRDSSNRSYWGITTQNNLLSSVDQAKYDLYIEAMEKTNSKAYEKALQEYNEALQANIAANENVQNKLNTYNEKREAYTTAQANLNVALEGLSNNIERYNYIIADDRINSTTPADLAYLTKFREINEKLSDNSFEDGDITELNLMELEKAKVDSDTLINTRNNAVTEAKNAFMKNKASWSYLSGTRNDLGFRQIFSLKDTEENYLALYNGYKNVVAQRATLREELDDILLHFLKDEVIEDGAVVSYSDISRNDSRLYGNEFSYYDNYLVTERPLFEIEDNIDNYKINFYDKFIENSNEFKDVITLGVSLNNFKLEDLGISESTSNLLAEYIENDILIDGKVASTLKNITDGFYTLIDAKVNDLAIQRAILSNLYSDLQTWWLNAYNFADDGLESEYSNIKETLERLDNLELLFNGNTNENLPSLATLRDNLISALNDKNELDIAISNLINMGIDISEPYQLIDIESGEYSEEEIAAITEYNNALSNHEQKVNEYENAYRLYSNRLIGFDIDSDDFGNNVNYNLKEEDITLSYSIAEEAYQSSVDAYNTLLTTYNYTQRSSLDSKVKAYEDYKAQYEIVNNAVAELATIRVELSNFLTRESDISFTYTGRDNNLYYINVNQSNIVNDYNLITRWDSGIAADLTNVNNTEVHFSASQSSNNKEKDIRVIYFEEPWEETIDNILYSHHYQLATKYDIWQAAIAEKTEAESEKLNIELREAMLISEKDRLQQTAFKQYTTTETQWNEEISRIFNKTYSLQTKKNTYNGEVCSYQYYKRALETDIFNKNALYFTWNDDFTELSDAVTNAINEMATAEAEWDAAAQAATLTLTELTKKDTILQSFNQNYIPLIVPENYSTDENFDKTATYYYNVNGLYYRINDSLDNYIGKIIYKDINFSKIENDLLNIIQIQLVDNEIPSLIEMYRQKIYDYQTAYEQFLMYNAGNSNGTIKLNNTSSQRLVIGEHFSVNDKGELKATAGRMKNIYLQTLNFDSYTDDNGNSIEGATGIVPKKVKIVTEVKLSGTKQNLPVSVSIHKDLQLEKEHTFHYPQYELDNGSFGVGSSAPLVVSNSTNMWYVQNHVGWSGGQMFTVTAYPKKNKVWTGGYTTASKKEKVTIPYSDTWTAFSNVPAITSVTLQYSYVNMWAFTTGKEQKNVKGGTVTNKV